MVDVLCQKYFNFSVKYFGHEADIGNVGPAPPPLPPYDPQEEAPKWDWPRIWRGMADLEVRPDIPKRGGIAKSDDTPDWRGVIKNNVIPADEITKYDFGQKEYPGYYWFDTPDYADPFKKLWSSAKLNARVALLLGASMAIIKQMDFNMKSHKFLMKTYVGPFFLGGMAASITVITVANLRGKKDDYWNYFAGAMMAANVTGWRGRYPLWVKHMNHMFYWTIGALSVKWMNENNGVLMPVYNFRDRNIGIHGNNAQEGLMSGEFPRIHGVQGDPGRDTRRHPI